MKKCIIFYLNPSSSTNLATEIHQLVQDKIQRQLELEELERQKEALCKAEELKQEEKKAYEDFIQDPRRELRNRTTELKASKADFDSTDIRTILDTYITEVLRRLGEKGEESMEYFYVLVGVAFFFGTNRQFDLCRDSLNLLLHSIKPSTWDTEESVIRRFASQYRPYFPGSNWSKIFVGYLFEEEQDRDKMDQPLPSRLLPYHEFTVNSPSLLQSLPVEILRLIFHFTANSYLPRFDHSLKDQHIILRLRARQLKNISLTCSNWRKEAQLELVSFPFITGQKSLDGLNEFISRRKLAKKIQGIRIDITADDLNEPQNQNIWKSSIRFSEMCTKLNFIEFGGSFDCRDSFFIHFQTIKTNELQFTSLTFFNHHDVAQTIPLTKTVIFNRCRSTLPISFDFLHKLESLQISFGSVGEFKSQEMIFPNLTTLIIDTGHFSTAFLKATSSIPNLRSVTIYLSFLEKDLTSLETLFVYLLACAGSLEVINIKLGYYLEIETGFFPREMESDLVISEHVERYKKELIEEFQEAHKEIRNVQLNIDGEDLLIYNKMRRTLLN